MVLWDSVSSLINSWDNSTFDYSWENRGGKEVGTPRILARTLTLATWQMSVTSIFVITITNKCIKIPIDFA